MLIANYCFFVEFPVECSDYYAPHPLICFQSIWNSTNCVREGYAYPANATVLKNHNYSQLNLL